MQVIVSIIKNLLNKIFKGSIFPVFNNELKGLRLIIDPLLPSLLLFRELDKESHYAYDIFIKPGNIIFDIGANIGLHTYYFARNFRNTKVYSFEPLSANVNYIKRIIGLNKLNNIQIIEKAVGAKSGTVYFDTHKNNHQGRITEVPSDLSVPITTLDDFINAYNIRPDFIKIDVEGAESKVLAGFKNMIASIYPIIIIELHTSEQCKLVADFLRPLDYSILRVNHIENWNKNKRFLKINNICKGGQAPDGFWGTIMGIPNIKFKSSDYSTA